MLPHLGHCRTAPPAFVAISVAKLGQVNSRWRMPGLQSEEPSSQRLYAGHQDRSLGPHIALESVVEVYAALVGLPHRHG